MKSVRPFLVSIICCNNNGREPSGKTICMDHRLVLKTFNRYDSNSIDLKLMKLKIDEVNVISMKLCDKIKIMKNNIDEL